MDEAINLAEKLGEQELKVDLMVEKGLSAQSLGNYSEAKASLLEAYQGYEALELFPGMATCAAVLGNIYDAESNF